MTGHCPTANPSCGRLFDTFAAHGPLLVVVDQPATIGALPVAVARACGHQVAYLPGLAMRRIADLYPGTAKTDARDAFIIADAARSLPHTLRQVDVGDDALAELEVLVGFDDDLAGEATRLGNRIRGLLTGIHPAGRVPISGPLDATRPGDTTPGSCVRLGTKSCRAWRPQLLDQKPRRR
ncbi:IS110 family transposase [Prauserella flavalba]|uniref:IS110 family transposase n=1 Tax=Prauserella flavalba TaxID=1477506 RepID=UPI0036EEE973